jgi:hypothetical protein
MVFLGTALALAGAAASAAQGLIGFNKKKQAEKAAQSAATKYRDIVNADVVNQYSGLAAQTSALDRAGEGINASTEEALRSTSDAGATGVIGGTGRVLEASREAQLDLDVKRQEEESRVAQLQAGEQADIEASKREAQLGLAGMELSGAQSAVQEGQQQMNAGISGLTSGLGNAGVNYLDEQKLYKKPKKGGVAGGLQA